MYIYSNCAVNMKKEFANLFCFSVKTGKSAFNDS